MNEPESGVRPSKGPSAAAGRIRVWFGRRRNRIAALALVAVGLFLAGGVAAQLVLPKTVASGPVVVAAPEPSGSGPSAATMPDIEGLELTIARRVLRSAGITATLTTSQKPAAGAAGMVLTQRPEPGEPIAGDITVEISTAASMPDVVGAGLDDTRNQLEALGAAVTVERKVAPSKADGTVLESTPVAGKAIPEVVTLVVADTGEGLPLAELDTVEASSCSSTDSAMLNGTAVQASITCSPSPPNSSYRSEPASIEWAIGRRAPILEFLAGAEDTEGRGGGTITVYGDGNKLATVQVKFGATREIRVDTKKVLRLRIEVTTTSEAEPEIVLGEARLLGTRKDLEILAGSR